MIEIGPDGGDLLLDGDSLTIESVVSVAREGTQAALSLSGKAKLLRARQLVEQILAQGRRVYGVNTGFGKFSDVSISPEDTNALQRNLIMSHAGGLGDPLPRDVVRGMMLLRANSLAKGYSGIRVEVVQLLLNMLNRDVIPVVPCKGSVGASGDLVPLAHIALVMIGQGQAERGGRVVPAREALAAAGLHPISLTAKEGLALINGTQYMSAFGCLALHDSLMLYQAANIAAAMSFEALEGIVSVFDPQVHAVRPHPGQVQCAADLRRLLDESGLLSKEPGTPWARRAQDAYTLRCIPQVHGASLDAIGYVTGVLQTEINSATDNPLLFPETGEVISCGNFHGEPLALALDFLTIAVSELGSISERRTERLVNPTLNGDLPPFLTEHGGLNSGLMILQYASAALASENKVLSHPASVDSIPTSGSQEDHVSMGAIAARKASQVVDNVSWVIAGEMLAAAQALDFATHGLGKGSRAALKAVREVAPHWNEDRILYQDLNRVHDLLQSGEITERVRAALEKC
jgi:histidine ammonia-lyase